MATKPYTWTATDYGCLACLSLLYICLLVMDGAQGPGATLGYRLQDRARLPAGEHDGCTLDSPKESYPQLYFLNSLTPIVFVCG